MRAKQEDKRQKMREGKGGGRRAGRRPSRNECKLLEEVDAKRKTRLSVQLSNKQRSANE